MFETIFYSLMVIFFLFFFLFFFNLYHPISVSIILGVGTESDLPVDNTDVYLCHFSVFI